MSEAKKKSFRFRVSDKQLLVAWSQHNNRLNTINLEGPKQIEAITELLAIVFKASVLAYPDTDMTDCPDKAIANISRDRMAHDTEDHQFTDSEKIAIYRYMADRTYNRCVKLLPKLRKYDGTVGLPKYLQENRNHYSESTGAIDWEEMASLFN